GRSRAKSKAKKASARQGKAPFQPVEPAPRMRGWNSARLPDALRRISCFRLRRRTTGHAARVDVEGRVIGNPPSQAVAVSDRWKRSVPERMQSQRILLRN